MKFFTFLFSVFLLCLAHLIGQQFSEGPKIVFIHIGSVLPTYLTTAIRQARTFNNCDIILVANKKAIFPLQNELSKENVVVVFCEDIKKTPHHITFLRRNTLDRTTREGFWSHTKERFFYLKDLISEYNFKNVVHLENDVMLYVDITELLPVLESEYPTLAATFDSDDRCIAGFFYVSDEMAMTHLTKFLSSTASKKQNDMVAIGNYRKTYGNSAIRALPIVHDTYVATQKLENLLGHTSTDTTSVCANIDRFHSIFDAAAIGQYLGGVDLYCGVGLQLGFINESCVFNPSLLTYEWEVDAKGRKVPFASFGGKKVRINNLHIHSKKLENFISWE